MRKLSFLTMLATLFVGYTASANNALQDSIKTQQLDEIIVSATRADDRSPVAFTNVSKKEIEKRNSGQDIPYLLSLTPSFITTSDAGTGIGYTGFRVRGTDANRTNITVNGIPLNDSESHGVFFVNMPDFATSLQSVQVQRGVGTSTNGAAAFGASINMQTEQLQLQSYAELNATVGSFGTMKNSIKAGTGLRNGFYADVRLSKITSDGYIDRASVDLKSYYLATGFINEKNSVKFITFGGNEKTYQAWNGVNLDLVKDEPEKYTRTYNELGRYKDFDGNIKYYDNQTDNYQQTHYQLHWSNSITDKLNLNLAAHYTRGKGYYQEYKDGRIYAEYLLQPATVGGKTLEETDLVRQKWLDNHFGGTTFSLMYQADRMKLILGGAANKYSGDHFGKVLWSKYPNNLNVNHEYYRSHSDKWDANVFAKLNYEVVDNLYLFTDLQYRFIRWDMKGIDDKYDTKKKQMRDITQSHPFNFFNPKVGINYRLSSNQSLYGSFAVSNREPNRNNYTDAGPNDKPTSERLYDTELGYQITSNKWQLGANVYYMKYHNQLILTGKISEIGEMLTSNIKDSYRTGIELMGGAKIGGGFSWNGNITLSQNKINDFTEYVDEYTADWKKIGIREKHFAKTDISFSPNVVANSILNYEWKDFSTSLVSTYVGKQYLDNTATDSRSIDSYFVNNLFVSYSWKMRRIRSIDFNVQVNNLFNTEYETNGYNWYSYYLGGERINEKRYFPQAGINFMAGVTVKF